MGSIKERSFLGLAMNATYTDMRRKDYEGDDY